MVVIFAPGAHASAEEFSLFSLPFPSPCKLMGCSPRDIEKLVFPACSKINIPLGEDGALMLGICEALAS